MQCPALQAEPWVVKVTALNPFLEWIQRSLFWDFALLCTAVRGDALPSAAMYGNVWSCMANLTKGC
jgi:hypothetical protein